MEKMNPYEFANLLCIFAQMDGRCADKTIRPRQMSFIEVESASDSTKKYEPICIDDIYVEYLYDRMDARQAAEEAINRIINAKEVVTKKAPEGPKAMNIMNIDSNHVLDILSRIMHDTDNIPPDEEPEEPEKPVAPVVKPVQPVQIARPSVLNDMLSALEDEDEEETNNTSAAPESNDSEKPDASGDLYNVFDDDEDSDLLSALEDEEDGMAEQKPAESDNDETEEEPEEAQEEEPSGLSLDESDGENDNAEENQEEKVVAVDIEQEMKDAFAKILNFKYRPSSSEEEEAKEIFDTLVKGASRNFFAKPASIKYDVKEEAKKPVNPNGNVSLGDVIAAALGMPEAGKLDTDTGSTEDDDFDL